MDLFRNKYRIDSARLADWDYSSNGFYFVTICTKNREPYFGTIQNTNLTRNETQSSLSGNETQSSLSGNETQNLASLQATDIGRIASQYWSEIPVHFPFVELDEFIIMPDHLHGILLFNKNEQSTWQPNKAGPQSRNLASVIRGFKAGVKAYATTNEIEFQWQPRYYDRVIRNSNELERIRKYIADNPANWLSEKGNPENLYR
jgi:REP element-mobilizing transposase RayT